jgi:hypothetical protein
MSSTMPTRIDGELFEAAKTIGAVTSRSAAQQIAYWARIGREVEASPNTNQRDIQRVLAGQADYDALGERAQAVVRASWDERISDLRSRLNLAAEFTEAGRSWTDADEQGHAIVRGTDSATD